MIVVIGGCNGSTTPQPPAGTATAAAAAPGDTTTATQPAENSNQPRRQNERWTDANGVEYLGNVPLDVFYDQPYTVVQDATPVGGTAVASGGGMGGMSAPVTAVETEPVVAAADAGGSSDDWNELIPLEILKEEVNSSRNFMNQSLQTVGAYNSSMLMIPPKAAAIAALATIAMEHPEAVSWQEDAKYIREFAKQMNASTLQRGKKDQARLLTLFENMSDTLNRSKPADLPEPPEDDSYADVAEMGLLMSRMDSAEKRMKNEAGTETAFGSQKEMIAHEAAILGALTKVATMPGYGYADDEEFRAFAKRVTDAVGEIRGAIEVNDFETYEKSLSRISISCTECHSVYRE